MFPGQFTEFSPSRSWSARLLTLCVFLAAAAAVLYLPYLFPLKPTNSYSYVFGYNNRVALFLVVGFAALAAFWSRGQLIDIGDPAVTSSKIPRKDLLWASVLTLLFCAAMIALVGRMGGFSESGYDLYRIYLTSLGKHPYRDFEWPFGVALLYVPLWTARLLHIGQQAAFYLVWTVAWLFSDFALFAIINRLRYPGEAVRRWIFWLLFLISLGSVLNLGLHYVALRYFIPILALLIAGDWSRPPHPRVAGTALLIIAATAIMLLTSPEMAVDILVAAAVLLWPHNRFTRSAISWAAYLLTILAMALLILIAARLGVFDTARASGGGADSLPLTLSASTLLFLVNVGIGFGALVWRRRHPDAEDNTPVLILAAIPLLPAALGRADSGHLYCNGLGFLIAAMVYLWPQRLRYAWLTLWVLAYGLPFALSLPSTIASDFGFTAMLAESHDAASGQRPGHIVRFAGWVLVRLPAGSFRSKETDRLTNARLYPIGDHYNFASLYPGVPLNWNAIVLAAPFGFNPSHSNADYRSPQVDLGFYQGEENANTPAAVQRKITELAAHPERPVLMPGRAEDGAPLIDYRTQQHELSSMTAFPYRAKPRHLNSIYAPLYDYLRAHYRLAAQPSPANHLYELWLPADR